MGIFSFLSGKKDDGRGESATAVVTPDTASEVTSPGPLAAGAGKDGAARAAAAEAAAFDSPYIPPEAWGLDTGALTAPSATPAADPPQVGPMDPTATAELQGPIIEVIKTVYDPEIPVDIYELGLIYEIIADAERRVLINMTLTSPACPSAQQIPSEVRYKVKAVPGVTNAWVEIVWEPAWGKERMSEVAKLSLGF
jgi:FeS assembly SUF system protein